MKKLIAIFLFFAMGLTLFGCSDVDSLNDSTKSEVGTGNGIGSEDVQKENDVDSPQGLTHECIAKTATNYCVLEATATKETAESIANDLIKRTIKELANERFIFYIIDNESRLLGEGDSEGYSPFVFSETTNGFEESSYDTLFYYFYYKYFTKLNVNGWESEDTLLPGGIPSYIFLLNAEDETQKEALKEAAETVVKLMNVNLGEDVSVTIKIFATTKNEIVIQSPGFDN